MEIRSIQIKNVRGIQDKIINLNMIPNKPSILVASNGSGKSSFAFAFQWLNRFRMKLDADEAYDDNVNNKPELIITTNEPENNVYKADENVNEVSKRFGIFVINNGIKASSPPVRDGIIMGRAKITVPEIELLDVPRTVNIVDDFDDAYGTSACPQGLFPSINSLLTNYPFMAQCDYEHLKITTRPANKIMHQIELIKTYTGTIVERHSRIEAENQPILEQFPSIKYMNQVLECFCPQDNNIKILLKSIRIITLAYRNSTDFKGQVEYAKYKINEERTRKLFDSLKQTWQGIKPHKVNNKLILKIGDAQRISNGERDILILLGMLQKARCNFTKKDNILIIDEVFDYLDDANLIAAQHYINMFVRELKDDGKNIYPIILSHINPVYFRTFAFRDMKVYYFNPLRYPNASDNMLNLVRKRDKLEEIGDKEKADKISKYMLHYHPNYSVPMDDIIAMNDPNWNDVQTFKSYCLGQIKEYLNGNKYDSLAVCVALREMIEKYCYKLLQTDDQRIHFIDQEYGTEKKLDYAETLGIAIPETFSLLGLVYNDPLHPKKKNEIDLRQTLYSRLDNNTIRGMISEIKEMYEQIP